jgi:hypothetical protein
VAATSIHDHQERDDMEPAPTSDFDGYEKAVIAGVRSADERLAAFGIDSTAVAFGRPPTVSKEARIILGAEGAAATLRVARALQENARPTTENVLRMVQDLHANPWDDGPLRAYTVQSLHHAAEVGHPDEVIVPTPVRLADALDASDVEIQARGLELTATQIARANDVDALNQRISSATRLSASRHASAQPSTGPVVSPAATASAPRMN